MLLEVVVETVDDVAATEIGDELIMRDQMERRGSRGGRPRFP